MLLEEWTVTDTSRTMLEWGGRQWPAVSLNRCPHAEWTRLFNSSAVPTVDGGSPEIHNEGGAIIIRVSDASRQAEAIRKAEALITATNQRFDETALPRIRAEEVHRRLARV